MDALQDGRISEETLDILAETFSNAMRQSKRWVRHNKAWWTLETIITRRRVPVPVLQDPEFEQEVLLKWANLLEEKYPKQLAAVHPILRRDTKVTSCDERTRNGCVLHV
jgi:hypothetical protein